jgi:hypothetical protein
MSSTIRLSLAEVACECVFERSLYECKSANERKTMDLEYGVCLFGTFARDSLMKSKGHKERRQSRW